MNSVRWLPFCVAGTALLTACVANPTVPPQNIGTVLSVDGTNKQAAQGTKTANLGLSTPQTPAATVNSGSKLNRSVKNSIAPASNSASPAQLAANQVANPTKRPAAQPKKSASLLGSLFNSNSQSSLRSVQGTHEGNPSSRNTKLASAKKARSFGSRQSLQTPTKKVAKRRKPVVKSTLRNGVKGLPGVRIKKIFGIDSEKKAVDLDAPVKVASVANLGRRGTHGLRLQRAGIKVGCFPKRLLRILKRVERRFGRAPVVTSGYRSRRYNRRIGGSRKSTHIRCLAADIQVKGVSKWKLAKYLRSVPGRGGVGTYCHTKSVHIDVGEKRAWHHCSRRRKSRRRKS